MGNRKQRIIGSYKVENKDGSEREICVTRPVDGPPCKGCRNEPRRNGSAFGEKCANQKRVQDMNDRNMSRRIALQAKENGNEKGQ